MKKDWTPQELKEIATWAQEQGGNVGQAAKRYVKAEECMKVELLRIAEQTAAWSDRLSGASGKA